MDKTTVYTKTAKGITQVNQKSASLSKDLMKVLKLIDGKSNFGQIMEKAEMDNASLTKAFTALQTGGFARVFQTQKKDDDPFAGEGGGDDFDFTAPGKMPGRHAARRGGCRQRHQRAGEATGEGGRRAQGQRAGAGRGAHEGHAGSAIAREARGGSQGEG
jgi:hypothetical protein